MIKRARRLGHLKGREGSRKVNTDPKVHRAETFATGAITTITQENAASFNYKDVKILFSCWRTFDRVRIQGVFPKDSVAGFSNTETVEHMGVRIYCTDTLCSLFPIEGADLKPGQVYYHFLLKNGEREMMASVSLDIRPVAKPCAARYTRDVHIQAAMAAYRTKCDAALLEMQSEIERILASYIHKVESDAAPIPAKTTPARISKANPVPAHTATRTHLRAAG